MAVLRGDLRDAGVLVRTELRCRLRAVRGDPRKLLAFGFAGLFFGVVFPLMGYPFVTAYGWDLATGLAPVGATGVALGLVATVGVYLGGVSGFSQESAGTVGPLVRTAIPPRAVAVGRLASELLAGSPFLVVVACTLLAEVAVGAGGPLPAVLVCLASLPVLLATLGLGRVVGTGVRMANRRLGVSLWTKAVLWVVLAVVGYVVVFQLMVGSVEEGGAPWSSIPPGFLPGRPLQAYAGLALAPLGGQVRPLGVAVAGGLLAAAAAAFGFAVRVEARLLVTEEGHRAGAGDDADEPAETTRATADAPTSPTGGVPRPFSLRPAGRIAWRYLVRTRRDPRTLSHLAPLLFGVLGMVGTSLQDPHLLLALGQPAAVVGGGSLAGAAYCLNPMGDDREQIPLLLTSAPSTAALLRGRVLAGLALGLPIAVGAGSVLGIASGTSLLAVVGASVFAVAFALAGAGTALGFGAVIPRFDRREYMSVERAHPSTWALLGFLFGGLVVGGIGMGLVAATTSGHLVPALVGWVVYGGVVATVGVGGYVYAVRRFDRLALDEV